MLSRFNKLIGAAAIATLVVTVLGQPPSHGAAAKPAAGAQDTGDAGSTIFAVVNDAPITTYNIDQRAKLLSLDGGGGWQQRLQAKLHAPDLQQRFKNFAIAHNPKSKEEVLALQKTFVEGLRQQAIAETRPGLRDRAAAQILNETVEMQEAKRLGVLATEDDLKSAVTEIAQRNKKTLKEFEGAIVTTGVDLHAFKERIRAQMSWQRVLEGRFRGQMVVGKADIEQEIASAGGAGAGGGATQLKLQRIVMPLKSGDAAASVAGYAAADALRQQAKPCVNFADIAKSAPSARFEDMGMVSTDALAVEVRPMLASAEAGSVPPPILTKAGIEIYGVCERGAVSAGETATAAAKDKIQHEKLDALSHALLSDLCAAASIEPRNGFKLAKPCGTE